MKKHLLPPLFICYPENHSAVGSAAAGGYFPVLLYRNLQRVCDNIDLFADSGQDDPRTGTPDVYQ